MQATAARLITEKDALIKKIEARTARVGVVGLGYVGLPLANEFAKAGFCVTGIDLDESKLSAVNAGKSYIRDVDAKEMNRLVREQR